MQPYTTENLQLSLAWLNSYRPGANQRLRAFAIFKIKMD